MSNENKKQLKIAIDFDGTIVENEYPRIGKEMLFAFETMKALQEKRHHLILWTFREGKRLQDAVDYCQERGITFYAVNKSYPEEVYQPNNDQTPRKLNVDLFIDDRNLGGFPGWTRIYDMLINKKADPRYMWLDKEAQVNYPLNRLIWLKIKSLFKK